MRPSYMFAGAPWWATTVVPILIGLGVGIVMLFFKGVLDALNTPPLDKQKQLVMELKELKKRGAGYHELMRILQERGCRKAVAVDLIVEAERENLTE